MLEAQLSGVKTNLLSPSECRDNFIFAVNDFHSRQCFAGQPLKSKRRHCSRSDRRYAARRWISQTKEAAQAAELHRVHQIFAPDVPAAELVRAVSAHRQLLLSHHDNHRSLNW